MLILKEPLKNPVDQLTWARSLLAFLSESTIMDREETDILKDAELGQSAILTTIYDIIGDVITILNEKQVKTKGGK